MSKELLLSLVGRIVKVDRGGPESRLGKLLSVQEDYFALQTEKDGVIYYRTHHIKSVLENTKHGLRFEENQAIEEAPFLSAADFASLLEGLRYRWVKINRGGKESVEGVLDDVNGDYATLIANEEVFRISLYHIRNISAGFPAKAKINPEVGAPGAGLVNLGPVHHHHAANNMAGAAPGMPPIAEELVKATVVGGPADMAEAVVEQPEIVVMPPIPEASQEEGNENGA
ncbi:MAG: hypothetical protein ACI35R_05215 [Bacillus sp. (in: firmicutes)]